MIYASLILPPFSSNFLSAYHYVYALDYHAIFPQFCVSLAHYTHYGVILWMDMRQAISHTFSVLRIKEYREYDKTRPAHIILF